MERPNASTAHGFCDVLLSPSSRPVRWVVRDGVILNAERPEPDFSTDLSSARRRLSGRTVFFIGDSNTRYQYLSLAFLLSTGAYPCEPQGNETKDAAFNICGEAAMHAGKFDDFVNP